MRILILNTLYHPFQVGGAERSTQFLAEGLARDGCEVIVACTKPDGERETRVVNGVKVHYVGLKNVYWQFDQEAKTTALKPIWHVLNSYNPMMGGEVAEIIEDEAPDVVHTHNLGGFSVAAWQAARRQSVPIVHTLRDYALLCPQNMFRNETNCSGQCLRCRPFAVPRRWLSSAVASVVGISRFILERHQRHGYFEDTQLETVIHNPFPAPDLAGEKEGEPDGPTPSPGEPLHVGFLGRLSPMKGIEHLLQTVADLDDRKIRLHVGGTGDEPYASELKQQHAGPIVEFCGYVDPNEFLPRLDVLVVPSRWHEPFGRVVIEAYAHAVPVIAACRGGLPEIVDAGRTGWTYDPGVPDSLKQTLVHVLDKGGPPLEMRQAAAAKARSFTVDAHVQSYQEVYQATLAAPSRASS
jgi:glycosyltransferase involved in cell wall biosynthesis